MPHQPFFAMIVPMGAPGGGERPEHPIYNPPGIWGPTDPRPTPPIVIPPDAISPGVPTHPIFIPVYPAHPIVIPPGAIGPGKPTHPIVLPPYVPAHPIVIPPGAIDGVHPEHPIVIPPPLGIWGPPDMPPGFWGGGMGPGVKPQPPVLPVPPDMPNVPPPGSPPVIVGGTQPSHPMVAPEAIIVDYPGIGKVVVPKPTQTASGTPKK